MDIANLMNAKGCFDPGVTCRMAPITMMWPVGVFVLVMFAYFLFESRRLDRLDRLAKENKGSEADETPKA